MCAKSLQSCPTLDDPMDCSPPGSSVHGILQAEYWSGLPCSPARDLPYPGIDSMSLMSPASAGGFFSTGVSWEGISAVNIFLFKIFFFFIWLHWVLDPMACGIFDLHHNMQDLQLWHVNS